MVTDWGIAGFGAIAGIAAVISFVVTSLGSPRFSKLPPTTLAKSCISPYLSFGASGNRVGSSSSGHGTVTWT